jgi:hypothetical protein
MTEAALAQEAASATERQAAEAVREKRAAAIAAFKKKAGLA